MINTELKNKFNKEELSIDEFITFLHKYEDYNIYFTPSQYGQASLKFIEINEDNDNLANIIIDCNDFYNQSYKPIKAVKLIKELTDCKKRYNNENLNAVIITFCGEYEGCISYINIESVIINEQKKEIFIELDLLEFED